MISNQKVKMTSSEISNLWAQYMSDSMGVCTLSYFLNKAEDEEIRAIIQYALSLSQDHIKEITKLFNGENIPIPMGFTNKDVQVDAPRLYSDTFYLFYLTNMAKTGLASYALALPITAREDIRKHFTDALNSSAILYNKTAQALLDKGVYTRAPILALTTDIDFVDKESFLSNWMGNKRSLLSIEVTHIFANMLTNVIGKPLLMGFGQVAKSKEVQKYMMRGKDISSKHIEVFSSTLGKEDIPAPLPSDTFVTDSTTPPFSDKLMMFHTVTLNGAGIGNYGAAIAVSLRSDISADYIRLIGEVGKYAQDGVKIMIDNEWLEQPPQVINHEKLKNSKKM